ncbi:MAG: hypothetical protein KGL39_35060 [Patescibacteria group bacterium]|nr:hypothetical protein [Patescibacteria group bacterium]
MTAMARKHALAGALALACLFTLPARAQVAEESALAFAAAGMGRIVQPLRPAARARRADHRVWHADAPLDIRTPTQLVAVAERYIGSRRFTRFARAWCADAMNAWLEIAGYRGTGDGRAISFAHYGRPADGPRVGSIAVMRHHVGIVVGRERGGVVLLSGNHNRRVGVGVYSARTIIAYREPV